MNGLDIAIVVGVIVLVVLGYTRGFIRQLVSIAGMIAAFAAAYFFYDEGADWVRDWIPLETIEQYDQYRVLVEGLRLDVYVYNALAFLLVFWIVRFGLAIIGRVLHWITMVPGLKTLNQGSGALLGLAEGLVLSIITIHVMAVIPSDPIQRTLEQSAVSELLRNWTPLLTGWLDQLWSQAA